MAQNHHSTANWAPSDRKSFNTILELYDASEFSKALEKIMDIEIKHPDHCETQSFKALVLNSMKKKTKAFEIIQKTLFKNMSNFTCWHVYGILNRSNKLFDAARKAFLNALKQDENNNNLLRDLSTL
jgi:tetratricopeptide (TPR) repeat protein